MLTEMASLLCFVGDEPHSEDLSCPLRINASLQSFLGRILPPCLAITPRKTVQYAAFSDGVAFPLQSFALCRLRSLYLPCLLVHG